MAEVAVGIDAGGTATRAIVVTASGEVVGRGSAGGGNPNSHPVETAAGNVAAAVAAALGPHRALTCVLGLAGASALRDAAVEDAFRAALRSVGVDQAHVVNDAIVAFAAGTPEPSGTVLIAGTGSIATKVRDHSHERTAGGLGWLLGDEGSAFWLGREAVRAALFRVQSGAEPSPLTRAVLDLAVGASDDPFAHLVRAVNIDAPIHLARFAPLVSTHADDPVAADIIERGARILADLVLSVWDGGPIVLAGTVAGGETPVGARLREMLGDHEVRIARDGVAGAGWLAARDAFGPMAPHPSTARVP